MRYQPARIVTNVKDPPVWSDVSGCAPRKLLVRQGLTHNLQPVRKLSVPVRELPIRTSQGFKSNGESEKDGHKCDICPETGQEKEEGQKSDEEEVECYDSVS